MSDRFLSIVPMPRRAICHEGEYVADGQFLHNVDVLGADLVRRIVPTGNITFVAEENFAHAAYRIAVTPGGVEVRASSREGYLNGLQTIRQFLLEGDGRTIPCCEIEDAPRFQWRGMHLDCSRHFIDKQHILRIFDLMALHKLNVFHWHLVDDQGWRLEIRKYPALTEIGAWRDENGTRHGGFYSQDDVREIIAYAAELGILVVPEIEMPGHTKSSLAAYPHLSCHGNPIKTEAVWGIFKDVYCAGKEEVFEFLEDVLTETAELFPSPYIHVGGDEVPKDNWKACPLCQARIKNEGLRDEASLQSYFIKRISRVLAGLNKRLIGWDEITEGGTPPGAVVHYWRDEANLKSAIAGGHRVIMSPHSLTYLNYPPTMGDDWPKWMIALPIEKVYAFDPHLDWMTPEQASLVLGGESALWTEWAPQDLVEWQLFPRLCAFAEVMWTAKDQRSFTDFSARMNTHAERLRKLGVQMNEKGTAERGGA